MAIPTRVLGRTGVNVSAVGFGGHHIGDFPTYEDAEKAVHDGLDAGIRYFDNCWEYHNGKSEVWLGRALAGRRDKAFVMTKVCTHGRGAELATTMLHESLRRLQTDHLDLWQIHGVTFDNDPELAYRKGGVLEALDEAKRDGKVRFVGFTGHKDPAIHRKMIEMGYPFDTVQMPLNCFDGTFRSFETAVLPLLPSRGIAALGMKPHGGRGDAIKQGVVTPGRDAPVREMRPSVATTICGIDSQAILKQVVGIASSFTPTSAREHGRAPRKVPRLAGDGRLSSTRCRSRTTTRGEKAQRFQVEPKTRRRLGRREDHHGVAMKQPRTSARSARSTHPNASKAAKAPARARPEPANETGQGSRAMWTGSIGFGLVQIAVKLYPRERTNDLAFHQVDKRDGSLIGYERVNKATAQASRLG